MQSFLFFGIFLFLTHLVYGSLFFYYLHRSRVKLRNKAKTLDTQIAKKEEDLVLLKIRLYEKMEREFHEQSRTLNESFRKIEKDIDTARRIQYSTLPSPTDLPSLEIGSLYMPLAEVSGDIYDFFELRPGTFRLMIADATGHGVQAGFLTMSIRTEYERIKFDIASPAEIIQRLNESIFQTFHNGAFFYTCIVLDFSYQENKTNWCSAGHPPFFLVRNSFVQAFPANCPVIGVSRSVDFTNVEAKLETESKLVLFTDGIYEFNQNQNEEFWGFTEFQTLVGKHSELNGQSFCNEVLVEIAEILSDTGFKDDITLLVISNR